MATPHSEAFQQAVIDSKKLTKKPNNDDLLALYALYKIGTGEDFASASAPGFLDLKGKAKYNAWKEKHEQGLTAAQAQDAYVVLIAEFKTKYEYDANKEPENV